MRILARPWRHAVLLPFLLLTILAWQDAATAAQLTLSWTDTSSNEDGFRIERRTGTSGTFTQTAAVGPNASSYADLSLTNGTTYCYRVQAYNTAGSSPYSNEACGVAANTNVTLTMTRAGTGSGTVTSSPTGISCGADCTESYSSGTAVILTATPAAGSTFTGWSGGGCSGTGSCTVTLSANTSVTATFTVTPATYTLTVTRAGTGSGTVASSPTGISCGADCTESYSSGTAVTLTATPAAGSTFTGWSSGGCSGTGSCTVTLTANTAVTAAFVPRYTLTVTRAGTGSGTVTSSPTGISCGADCTESYSSGAAVTLTATPAAGSTFTGWSGGGCSGAGSCTVTLSANTSVTATFTTAPTTYTLIVTRTGTGSGTVTSSPTGISCGADCSEPYPSGRVVTLTATPATGSAFTGWSGGGCSGAGSCTITLGANTSVTATFRRQTFVKIGVFRPSTGRWYLDLNGNGVLEACTIDACIGPFGQSGNRPVVGDWSGAGTTQIGVFDPSTRTWRLDRSGNDQWDDCSIDLCLGPIWQSTDLPVVGRWTTSSTRDLIGIYRPSWREWRLDLNGNGVFDGCSVDSCPTGFGGNTGDLPVVGDWTGTTTTKLGLFTPSTRMWKLDRNGNRISDSCTVDSCLGPFGASGDLPVAGDWNGTGTAKIGVFDPTTGMWDLDLNGNGVFNGCAVDACMGPFGQTGDLPVVGRW